MAADRLELGSEPPNPDVFEVSLFGRGVGEALAVHAGGGSWVIVDSFRVPGGGRDPIALAYLQRLGVSPEQIELVVSTHWDDDHAAGLAQTLGAAVHAEFACTAAFQTKEAIAFLFHHQQRTVAGSFASGTKELVRCLELARARGRHPKLVKQDSLVGRHGSAEFHALTPSDGVLARNVIALLGPEPDDPTVGTAVRSHSPNASSVALWVQVGDRRVLLGADVEEAGWQAALGAAVLDGDVAGVIKVPHHGSAGADHPQFWQTVIEPQPDAILAPYSRSKLPRPADLRRLLARTPSVHVAARAAPRRHYEPVVRRMVAAATVDGLQPLSGPVGQVRLRAPIADATAPWSIDRFGSAVTAQELLADAA